MINSLQNEQVCVCCFLLILIFVLVFHREAKTTVQYVGETVLDFAGAYYEDHIQPVTESYARWASDIKSSMWEKIQSTIHDYMPNKEN